MLDLPGGPGPVIPMPVRMAAVQAAPSPDRTAMPIYGARVRRIRGAIAAGTYALDPAATADALFDAGRLR